MKDNFWTYTFGAVGAIAGIVYLWTVRNQQPTAPVTNVFPPLNTGDPASTASTGDPLPTAPTQTITTPTSQTSQQEATPIYYA